MRTGIIYKEAFAKVKKDGIDCLMIREYSAIPCRCHPETCCCGGYDETTIRYTTIPIDQLEDKKLIKQAKRL